MFALPDPDARVAEHAHPGAVGTGERIPRQLHRAEDAFGVGHQDRHAAVRRRERGDAGGRAVGVRGVALGDAAVVVDEARGDQARAFQRLARGVRFEFGAALAVRHGDRGQGARHAREQDRRAGLDAHARQAGLELLAAVAHETRPPFAPGTSSFSADIIWQPLQTPSVKVSGRAKNRANMSRAAGVKQDRFGPALAGAQHVAVTEAAAGGETAEMSEVDAPAQNVAHVDVDRLEPGAIEGGRHFDLPVHALLAQDGDARARRDAAESFRDVIVGVEGHVRR